VSAGHVQCAQKQSPLAFIAAGFCLSGGVMLPHRWRGQDPKPNTDAQRLGLELPTIADVDAELILLWLDGHRHPPAVMPRIDMVLDRRLTLMRRL
jgi:hypothetical protein